MGIASGLAFRAGHFVGATALLIIGLCVASALAFAGAAWIVDLLQPEPEIVIMAPLRWR